MYVCGALRNRSVAGDGGRQPTGSQRGVKGRIGEFIRTDTRQARSTVPPGPAAMSVAGRWLPVKEAPQPHPSMAMSPAATTPSDVRPCSRCPSLSVPWPVRTGSVATCGVRRRRLPPRGRRIHIGVAGFLLWPDDAWSTTCPRSLVQCRPLADMDLPILVRSMLDETARMSGQKANDRRALPALRLFSQAGPFDVAILFQKFGVTPVLSRADPSASTSRLTW